MRTYQKEKEPNQQVEMKNNLINQSQPPAQQQKQQIVENKKINQSTATMFNQLDPTLQSNYHIDNEFYNSLLGWQPPPNSLSSNPEPSENSHFKNLNNQRINITTFSPKHNESTSTNRTQSTQNEEEVLTHKLVEDETKVRDKIESCVLQKSNETVTHNYTDLLHPMKLESKIETLSKVTNQLIKPTSIEQTTTTKQTSSIVNKSTPKEKYSLEVLIEDEFSNENDEINKENLEAKQQNIINHKHNFDNIKINVNFWNGFFRRRWVFSRLNLNLKINVTKSFSGGDDFFDFFIYIYIIFKKNLNI